MSTLTERAHGTAVEKRDEGNTMQAQIRRMEDQFQLAMPRGVEASQLVRDAITALRTTDGLMECDPASVLGGLMTCAQLGLRVGVLGQAWLLPFYDYKSKGKKAQLIVGYQGLISLAYRSEQVASIAARVVYANDPVFEVEYGTEDRLVHKPATTERRGEPIAYYSVVHIKSGRPIFYVMSKADMEDYRDQYATAKKRDGTIVGPWKDNFEGMALKTVIRQLSKWMPKSTEFSTALMADEGVRVDLSPQGDAIEATQHYAASDTIDGEVVDEPQGGEQQ
jgi:recombination protein RecT